MAVTRARGKSGSGSSSTSSKSGYPSSRSPRSSVIRTRVREYLTEAEGRGWNPNSPQTPEGRLSKFNDEDWFVPTVDENGHKDPVSGFFLHPAIVDEISQIINSKSFPIKSHKEFFAIAAVELIRVLGKMKPLKNSHMSVIDAAMVLNRMVETTLSYEDIFAAGRMKIEKLLGKHLVNEARKTAQQFINIAARIPEKEIREKYKADLEYDFHKLLSTGGKRRLSGRKR